MAATPYTREYRTWGDAPAAPCADTLDIKADNVSRIVVDAQRARIDCNVKVNLSADGPVDVEIVNASSSPCGGTVVPASASTHTSVASLVAGLPDTAARTPSGAAPSLAALGLLGLARRVRRRGSPRR